MYEHVPNKDLDLLFVFNDLSWEMIVPFVDICRNLSRVKRRVSLVEQELLTLPEHLSSLRLVVGFALLELLFSVYYFEDKIDINFCYKSNTTGATSGAGTSYPSGSHEFTPGF